MSIQLRVPNNLSQVTLPWLERCPGHWKIVRPKSIFRRMQRPVRPEDEVITCFRDGTVTLRKNRRTTGFTEALQEIGYQGIRKGDLVIHAMDAFAGAIGVSDSDGKGTPVYAVCQPSPEADAHYYALILREMSRSEYLLSLAKGIRERSTDFRFSDFAALWVPMPPRDDQAQIVRFTRHLDQRVNRLIKTKRRLIELLTEQKQAIIHRAVTRGLDPNVALKPSGIDWLGDVPKHWQVKPLKRWASMNSKTLTDKTPGDFEFRYLDIGTVGTGRLVREPEKLLFENAPSRARRVVRSGDTIISTVRTYLKAMYFIETVKEPIIASTGFAVLSPARNIIPRYLSYLIQSSEFINRVTANSVGIAYPAISESKMGAFHLAVPAINEQNAILTHLDLATEPFDSALAKAQAEIDLIREYRTRLVADVVTGQLDVRHLDLPELGAETVADAEVAEETDETDEDPETLEPELAEA